MGGVAFGSGHAAVIRRDLASTALLGWGVVWVSGGASLNMGLLDGLNVVRRSLVESGFPPVRAVDMK